jgi:hypothetical protein
VIVVKHVANVCIDVVPICVIVVKHVAKVCLDVVPICMIVVVSFSVDVVRVSVMVAFLPHIQVVLLGHMQEGSF